jgi:hypothetical protein
VERSVKRGLGAGHGLELHLPSAFRLAPDESTMGDAFTEAIARFVRDGDPSSAAMPWAPYDAPNDSYLEVDATPSEKSGYRTQECDFWESAGRSR